MSELDDLRDQVRKRQQAANAKVRRLSNKGIEISGTEYDPRREAPKLKRYTRKQLTTYLNELNSFTSRSNQFVKLSQGFVPAEEWRAYKRPESEYNRIARREYSRVKDTLLPTGLTIEEREARMRPPNSRFRSGVTEAGQRIYEPVNLKPENVANPSALRKLTAFRRKQVSKTYAPSIIKKQRQQMRAMVDRIGDADIRKATESLTDEQFSMLWNYGSFATDVSRDYERVQLLATGGAEAEYDKVVEDAKIDIIGAINWSKSSRPRGRKR